MGKKCQTGISDLQECSSSISLDTFYFLGLIRQEFHIGGGGVCTILQIHLNLVKSMLLPQNFHASICRRGRLGDIHVELSSVGLNGTSFQGSEPGTTAEWEWGTGYTASYRYKNKILCTYLYHRQRWKQFCGGYWFDNFLEKKTHPNKISRINIVCKN